MRRFAATFFILFLFLLGSRYAWSSDSIHLACDPWPPYQIVDGNKVGGFNAWVVREVLDRLGKQGEFAAYPWARTIHMMESGNVSGLFSIEYKGDRERFAKFPDEELSRSHWVFWTRKESGISVDSWEDIQGRAVGVVGGYSYTSEFWEKMQTASKVEVVSSDEQNLMKLSRGRLDVVPAELYNGRYILRANRLHNVVPNTSFIFKDAGLFLAFSHSVEEPFISGFAQELREFKQTEEYKEMYGRYFR